MSMLPGMLRFEWRYLTRNLTFLGIALVFVAFSLVMVRTGYGGDGLLINSPYVVTQSFGLLTLWCLFMQTIFCVNGVLRDDEHRMRELIFSRPIPLAAYVGTRFAGQVLAGFAVMLLAAIVLMVAPDLIATDPARVGPVRVSTYAWVLLTLVSPNLVLIAALLFSVAAFTRSAIATYIGGVGIFALYMVTALLVDSPILASSGSPTPEALARAAMLDPFGLSAFSEQTRYWTPAERNVRLVALEGRYLWNRLLWLGIAASVLAATYRYASWTSPRRTVSRPGDTRRTESAQREPSQVRRAEPVVAESHARRAFGPALVATLRFELRRLFGARAVQLLLLVWLAIAFTEARTQLIQSEYGTRALATSGLLADELSQQLGLVCTICLVWFAADVVWSDRIARVDGITDATPASSAVFYLSRLITLWTVVVALTTLAIVAALVVQFTHPHLPLNPLPLLGLFWFVATPACLFAVAAVAIQVLAPNRWIGIVLTLLVAVLVNMNQIAAIEHPMLRYTAAPGVSWSDLDGYGPAATSFSAFTGYWATWALLIGTVSWGAWRRGVEVSAVRRVRALLSGQAAPRRVLIASGVVVAVAAAALFSQTNLAHAWVATSDGIAWRAEYERTYRRLQGAAQPSVTAADMTVDFFPERRAARVQGVLTLQNRSARPIDTLWIALRRDVSRPAVTIDGATLVSHDVRFNVWSFALQRPLAPGAATALRYSIALERGGIRADGFDRDAARNGSYLTMVDILPTLGYRPGYELRDLKLRSEYQLGAGSEELMSTASTDSLASQSRRSGQTPSWLTLRATLSTSADQSAIGPGTLVRSWAEGGRRHFEYRVDTPMTPAFAFVSGSYARRTLLQNGVMIEVWHHPAHGQNVDQILKATATTLAMLGTQLSPYRLPVLRVVEIPSGWRFGGFALTGMLVLTENRGVLMDERAEDVDLLTRRVAHEVSHQWWGHTVSALPVPGGSTITESLAKHSERLVIQALHGDAALPQMLAFEHDEYLSGRARETEKEPTLIDGRDDDYIYYRKGALAMHALTDALGEAAVRRALAALVAREAGPNGAADARGLRDLLLHEATNGADSALVSEWFDERVIYELSADSASSRPRGDSFGITGTFSVRRVVTGDRGETVRPADGTTVEVVVFGAARDNTDMLWSGRIPVVNGRGVLDVTVPRAPAVVELDPRFLRIDRERSNNRRKVVALER
jgi:ABC-2 type transport system permease protein